MEIDNYLAEYNKFHVDCGHDVTSDACLDKLYEECKEFMAAYESGITADIISERLDVMNTALFSTFFDGMADPLHFGWLKLQQTKEKYKKEGKI